MRGDKANLHGLEQEWDSLQVGPNLLHNNQNI